MAIQEGVLETLDRLIGNGELKSIVDQYADSLRASSSSFYQREFRKNGHEAAEKLLIDVVRHRGLREFSDAIEPITIGMRDIASSNDDVYSRVFTRADRQHPPLVRFDSDTVSVLVLYDLPQHEGCGCTQPDGAEIFGQCGALPLKALLLVESSSGHHKLCLVFPMRDKLVGVVERSFIRSYQ